MILRGRVSKSHMGALVSCIWGGPVVLGYYGGDKIRSDYAFFVRGIPLRIMRDSHQTEMYRSLLTVLFCLDLPVSRWGSGTGRKAKFSALSSAFSSSLSLSLSLHFSYF